MSPNRPARDSAPPPLLVAEVRYPLPQLLRELEVERSSAAFSQEKLDQGEIGKLFKSRTPPRRVKPKK